MSFGELRGICVSYDKKNMILRNLDLDIHKGELLSLLGPSGCGKTTTLRVIAGLMGTCGGTFVLDGNDMTHVPVHKRGFGVVFQSYALFPHLTVRENIGFGLKMRKTDKEEAEKKIRAMAAICGIEEYLDSKTSMNHLSEKPSSGNTLDLFTQMKAFAVLNKNRLADRTAMPASSIVPLVTRNAGKALGRNIGQLREGFESDISVLSLSDPNMIPCYDPYSVLVYSAQPQNVTDVYIKGKAMLESGKFTFPFNDMVSSFNEAASGFRREAEKLL